MTFSQCTRKKAYPTYSQAREVLQRMRSQRDQPDPTLHVYLCAERDHFHIGHARGRKAGQLIKRWTKRAQRDAARELTRMRTEEGA